jgi:hypothetical protein
MRSANRLVASAKECERVKNKEFVECRDVDSSLKVEKRR